MVATSAPSTVALEDIAERRQERREKLWVSLGVLVLAMVPFIDQALGIGRLGAWIPIFVFIILAMGLNIVVGYAGLLDLGYVAFFVIGAYSAAFLTSPNSVFVQAGLVPEFFQNFWPAMAVGWVLSALFGVLLGAPTLRLRGDYLAIVTLGFGEIVPDFFVNAAGITGGPNGIGQIARPPTIVLPGGFVISFTSSDLDNWYWLVLAVGVLTLFIISRFYKSRLGRSWQAVREDEIAAGSMGVNLVRTKLWAFALGASFSGFAGSVYAGYITVVYPDQFQFSTSIIILAMVILGGLGNIYGVIIGGFIIQVFDRVLAEELNTPLHWLGEKLNIEFLAEHDLQSDRFLIFGLALVLMMILRPGGLFPNPQRAAEMRPDDEDVTEQELQTMYDVRAENEPAAGERA
jgi:branched-chain amino acid transport system permease protein